MKLKAAAVVGIVAVVGVVLAGCKDESACTKPVSGFSPASPPYKSTSFAVTCGGVEHAIECSRDDVAKSFSCKCLSAGKTTKAFDRKEPLPGSPDGVAEQAKPELLTIMNKACGWKLK